MTPNVQAGEVVLPAQPFDETLAFFVDVLGFTLMRISPADDPAAALMQGHGLRIHLDRRVEAAPGTIRLSCTDPTAIAGGAGELVAPNGTRIELVEADAPVTVPPVEQSFVLTHLADESSWVVGRAGMRYRDLVPGRQGGRFIASHIHIPDGGPVPDYVHFHDVRFQLIYCYRGWVKVVYEDQGEPFVLEAGDCVLQPPGIRHRVLESSAGLEVIEIGCPAEHDTFTDADLVLPTGEVRPNRTFDGQRFVRHRAAEATWEAWQVDGFEHRDTGIGEATDGLGGLRVVRPTTASETRPMTHDGELLLHVVLDGAVTIVHAEGGPEALRPGDSFVIPAGVSYALAHCSRDLELLDVRLPAATSHRSGA
ncbi:MAG: cupin domain-containing protein [Acidimicrobiia bacterium]|nr:cupin domain-containing protein [Acidimicrobiia bacterium]